MLPNPSFPADAVLYSQQNISPQYLRINQSFEPLLFWIIGRRAPSHNGQWLEDFAGDEDGP